MSALKNLEGRLITEVGTEVSITYPLNILGEDLLECPVFIRIEDFWINIYNPLIIDGLDKTKSLKQLVNKKVLFVNESSEFIEIHLEDNIILRIDLRDESFTGPEALSLHGPNNLIVVWN